MRYLIINADDFGISEGVNNGIIEAWKAGVLTSTSIMPMAPAFNSAISKARLNPNLSIGLHFSTSSGHSCARAEDVKTFVYPDGKFLMEESNSFEKNLAIAYNGCPKELETELRAQFQAVTSTGFRPHHIDCHQAHIYACPPLFSVILKSASELGVIARFPFGDNIDNKIEDISYEYNVTNEKVRYISNEARKARTQFKTRTSDRYFQLRGNWNKDKKRTYLKFLIETLPEGISELCVHPGMGKLENETDLELITETEFIANIESNGIVITNPLLSW